MKILWLVNIPLPEASNLLNEKECPYGGWLVGASDKLSRVEGIELSIMFPHKGIKGYKCLQGKRINHYAFSTVKNKGRQLKNNNTFKKIINECNPDIVHIFGTEYSHTLSMVNTCEKMNILDKVVINIQGLCSIIPKHYNNGIPKNIIERYTINDIIKNNNIEHQRKQFIKKGKLEEEAINKVKHVIGRTDWDKACTLNINKNINYYSCNEILRSSFYNGEWNIDKCEKYSIFVSQCAYPVKGFHFMLEAMPNILKRYPDAKLYTTGFDILSPNNILEKLKMNSYRKYLRNMIKKLNLDDKVIFLGVLNEREMQNRFLKTNIFVSPSTIENESNSISEAKIMGVPVVSSYVGGVTNRISHYKDGILYQHDAPYMLAHYICEIFKDNSLALELSLNAKVSAAKIHDKEKNISTLLDIYRRISK